MNGSNDERLYNLLPALYRRHDPATGEALRALMFVLESQFKELEQDITASYNNWFIETCDDWVLSYIAELVGLRNLSQEKHKFSTQRRQIANTIGYRRRKGTIATLEHVVRDATGWLACAVEFDQRLAVTQHQAAVRPEQGSTVDVRRIGDLAEPRGPFEGLAYTARVCPELPESASLETLRSGQYHIGEIGLYIWRLRSFRMTNCRPRGITALPTLLDFLNQARRASEIVQRIGDDPRFGPPSKRPYGVRPSLARRMIEVRDRLPKRRFETLEQVDAVLGVGLDTLHDMLASFPGLYTFHPLGVDMPLFNWPQYITEIDQRARSLNMPVALSRAKFAADLEQYEALFGDKPEEIRPSNSRYYGPDRGLHISIWSPGSSQLEPVQPSRVLSMDLSQWDQAQAARAGGENPTRWVAIDVQLGRLALLSNLPYTQGDWPISDEDLRVTYCYGSSTPLGGGPYHRHIARGSSAGKSFHIDVAKGAGRDTPACVPTLSEALERWYEYKEPNPRGVIRILDHGLYDEQLEIRIPKGARLSIEADNGVRPVIGRDEMLTVVCEQNRSAGNGARQQLHLNGLLIHGGLQIGTSEHPTAKGGLSVTLEHCTLVTSEDGRLKPAGIEVKIAYGDAPGLGLSVNSSIVGPLVLPQAAETLQVNRSIVDGGPGYAIAGDPAGVYPGPALNLENVTIYGKVHGEKVLASGVIFRDPIKVLAPVTEDQIRYSYVPQGSITLPEGEAHPSISTDIPQPHFTSTNYGDPGYAQLSLVCPGEIRGGAANGSEMGAFHELYQLQAEGNLREVLEEYLPVGLHASIHYVT
jgi:hypothetical protein